MEPVNSYQAGHSFIAQKGRKQVDFLWCLCTSLWGRPNHAHVCCLGFWDFTLFGSSMLSTWCDLAGIWELLAAVLYLDNQT